VGSDPNYSQRLSSDGWLDHEGVAQTHRRGKPTINKLALEKLSSLRTDLWFGVPEHTVYCMTSPVHLFSEFVGCRVMLYTRLQPRLRRLHESSS
jgi:hypothetical protein